MGQRNLMFYVLKKIARRGRAKLGHQNRQNLEGPSFESLERGELFRL